MIKELVQWAHENRNVLEAKGIRTEKIFLNDFSSYVDHKTRNCIGRVIANIDGHIEIEIFEIESGIKLMQAYYAFQTELFDDFVNAYVRILTESTDKLHSKYHLIPVKTNNT